MINSGRLRKIEKMAGYDDDEKNNRREEEGVITAIPKEKAEDLLEVIRNGMDKTPEQASVVCARQIILSRRQYPLLMNWPNQPN